MFTHRHLLPFALTACSLPVLTGVVSADTAAEAQKSIRAAYAAEDAAAAKKDVNGVTRRYAPDYIDIAEDGKKKNLQQTRQGMRDLLDHSKNFKLTQKITKFTLNSSSQAAVVVTSHFDATVLDPNKTAHKLVAFGTSQDVWGKSGKDWIKKSRKTLKTNLSIDGQSQK